MKICEYTLSGANQSEISTEIKFLLASARFDGAELMRFVYETNDNEQDSSRLYNTIIKVLRSLRTRRIIQFFVMPTDFSEQTREAEFLLNKYSEHFDALVPDRDKSYFYIKI